MTYYVHNYQPGVKWRGATPFVYRVESRLGWNTTPSTWLRIVFRHTCRLARGH